MFDYLQFRYRRQARQLQRTRRLWQRRGNAYVDRNIWGKWHQVRVVRRLLFAWWGLLIISAVGLISQTQQIALRGSMLVAVSGGTYSEAEVGDVQIINPILPSGTASDDINRLIFSGLTQYDSSRHLVSDLAASWDTSTDGRTYTFHLRPGLTWQDGIPFTADDVVFTLAAIQNPDTRSPLAPSWQGVKVAAKDQNTLVFTLPEPLASFLSSTTVGILPRHLLDSVDPQAMRNAAFNQNPIGTGPFKLKTFSPSAGEVTLAANNHYYAGRPRLDQISFRFYSSASEALSAYAKHQVLGVARIQYDQLAKAATQSNLTVHTLALPEAQILFFRQGDSVMADASLRSILIRSLDRAKIVQAATAGHAKPLQQPLLPGQLGYTNRYAPSALTIADARTALDSVRLEHKQTLHLSLVTLRNGELERAAQEIARQWAELGVQLDVKAVTLKDLQQSYLRSRHYQLLLYGENIGADADVYPYWHSSQISDPGLNLSQYQSKAADRALEAGRILTDPTVRAAKYDAFLKAWDADQPAAVLYQPVYLYAQDQSVMGLSIQKLVNPADRFYGIERWTALRRWVQR